MKLKPEDIDTERKLIHIKGGKGRKNRYTILSDIALDVLAEYIQEYKPQRWLFPRANPGKHITARIVQAIFEHPCEKASIGKEVSVHSLRYSFTTHLMVAIIISFILFLPPSTTGELTYGECTLSHGISDIATDNQKDIYIGAGNYIYVIDPNCTDPNCTIKQNSSISANTRERTTSVSYGKFDNKYRVVVGSTDKNFYILEPDNVSKRICNGTNVGGSVNDVVFSGERYIVNKSMLAVASLNGTFLFTNCSELFWFNHSIPSNQIVFAPLNGERFMVVASNYTKGVHIFEYNRSNDSIDGITFVNMPKISAIGAGAYKGRETIFLGAKEKLYSLNPTTWNHTEIKSFGSGNYITHIDYGDLDGDKIAISLKGKDDSVHLLDSYNGEEIKEFREVRDVNIVSVGDMLHGKHVLLYGSSDGKVCIVPEDCLCSETLCTPQDYYEEAIVEYFEGNYTGAKKLAENARKGFIDEDDKEKCKKLIEECGEAIKRNEWNWWLIIPSGVTFLAITFCVMYEYKKKNIKTSLIITFFSLIGAGGICTQILHIHILSNNSTGCLIAIVVGVLFGIPIFGLYEIYQKK